MKYGTYIESLQAAMALRLKKRGEKALEHALRRQAAGDDDDDEIDAFGPNSKGKWKGRPEEDTIMEGEEPPPSSGGMAGLDRAGSGMRHRRETAEADEEGSDE